MKNNFLFIAEHKYYNELPEKIKHEIKKQDFGKSDKDFIIPFHLRFQMEEIRHQMFIGKAKI